MVLPALHRPPAGGRRDRPVRPLLVQPRRRREGPRLLHARASTSASSASAPPSSAARRRRDHPPQVLVLGLEEEQAKRFEARIDDPLKQWKLSPDRPLLAQPLGRLLARQGRDVRPHRHPGGPWHIVESDVKRHARINCISHLLENIPYEAGEQERVELPKVQSDDGYKRPPEDLYAYVPDVAKKLIEEGR